MSAMALLVTAGVGTAVAADADADGTDDAVDNCPGLSNRTQGDCNGNGVGDACEGVAANQDTDGDGRCNGIDNCPALANVGQGDCNANGIGDVCEALAANQDPDNDGRCTGADNCPSFANAAQSDCNGNGVGDPCEAATANRDTDGDGICNAADACPREAGACGMRAITVPWVPSNPTMPHVTWSGNNTTLKGIARYGGNQYMWDYGDGSAPMAWTAITNPYNLGVKHVYTGAVGQLFIATLSVRNSAAPDVVSTATYPIRIDGAASVGTNPPPVDTAGMDLRVNVAIDEGLWYLHTTQTRGTYADGAPGYAEPYGNWSGVFAGSCASVDAFQLNGSKLSGDYATNPYVETVQRGLTYMLGSQTVTSAVISQSHGNPDTNGNGLGVLVGPNDTYTNGICGVTLASSGVPNIPSPVGQANVRGRYFRDLTQDMVDWFAFGQTDTESTYRGGWMYSSNQQVADGSTNQWPPLVMAAAEANMGSVVPPFVRREMVYFLNNTRHTALDTNHGGWGYQGPNDAYVNHAKTAAGISLHHFLHTDEDSVVYKAAEGFLYRNWALNNYGAGGAWNVGLGNSYAMYGVMKAMRLPEPDTTRIYEFNYNTNTRTGNSFDWYYSPASSGREGLAVNLVKRQATNGSWSDTVGNNAQSGAFATGWDILILSKGVTTIPPQATICACAGQEYDQNQDVTVDGSCSTHPEQTRTIVSYEWDFNYNGSTFDSEASGANATKVGGYAMYGTYPVALRVTDDNPPALGGPQTNIVTCNIVIKPPPHCPHVDAGGPYAGFLGTPLTFDGTGTFDPDNDPLTYAWDLDNDGVFGAADNDVFGFPSDGIGVQPAFTYHATRFAPVAVRVTDHPSQNAFPYEAPECTVTAYSTVEIGNHAPVANPGGPYTALTSSTIQLDGSASSDVDPGDVLTYAWDLNNDGVFNDSSAVNPNFTAGTIAAVQSSVCLKVTDLSGATNTRCTTVTTIANRAPTCDAGPGYGATTCAAGNIPLALVGGGADADGDALTFTWTTNCGGAFADDHQAQTTLNLAPVCSKACTATLAVSDGKVTTTCSAPVAVGDTTAPTFTQTPADTTAECGADSAEALADWLISVSAADACGQVTTSTATHFAGGACGGDTGATTAVFTATDACNNAASASATFTIVDTTDPTVNAPVDATFESDGAGNAAEIAAWLAEASGADDCSAASLVNDYAGLSDGCGDTGSATVSFTATDACGREATRSATVRVGDTIDPVFADGGPSALSVECGADRGAADLTAWLSSFGATDVNGASVTNDFGALAPDCGGTGHATVTFTAADACGNDTTAQAAFSVVDTAGPEYYLAPADLEIECDANTNAAALAEWLGSAAAEDACGAANIGVQNDFVALSDLCGLTGEAAVNFVAADACGNETRVSATVAIVDRTGPSIAAGAAQDKTVECDGQGNQAELNAWLASVNATDRCGNATVGHTFPGLSDACGATGAGVATWTATDECGNAGDSVQATFTVVDTRAPVFSVIPQDLVVESDGDGNSEQLQQWLANVAAADTCGDVTITNDFTALSDGPGHTGTALVTWTATDACGQNKTTTSARFTIQDTAPPVVSCPGQTLELSADDCTGTITLNGTAEDTDGGQITLSHTYAFSAVGTQSFTYTFRDPSGNEATCTQTVEAVDVTAPVVTCAADATLNLGATTCQAEKAYTSTARDNCGGTMNQAHTFSFSAPGSDTFTYTFTDASGHAASCTQTVRAVDVTPPTYVAGPVTQLWSPNHQYVAVNLAQCGTFRDACGGVIDPAAGAGRVTRISSDELELSKGSGNFRDDMVIQSQSTVGLRSEREGGGDGRVYRIHFTLSDAAGNTSTAQTCRVDVPHDQSGRSVVEGAPVYWEP